LFWGGVGVAEKLISSLVDLSVVNDVIEKAVEDTFGIPTSAQGTVKSIWGLA
jgi:hypothetical protein